MEHKIKEYPRDNSEFRDESIVNAALCNAEDSKLLPDDIDWDAELEKAASSSL